jgi:hypothetical protein
MKDDILFYESQPGWRNWILVAVTIFASFHVGGVLFLASKNIDENNFWIALIISLLALGLMTCLLFVKLRTFVTEEGIYVKYFPFLFKTKFFSWNNIQNAYIRKYGSLKEYGGWGVRSSFGNGNAYNVYGNIGLQIVFQDEKRLLIGTNQAEELEEILKILNDKRKQK